MNYTESWQRSDNPVFVFSSLLTQHQFSEQNFAIGPLNRPDAMNNFQSQVVLDQTVWDAGLTKQAGSVSRTRAGRWPARTSAANAMDVIAGVVRAYNGVVLEPGEPEGGAGGGPLGAGRSRARRNRARRRAWPPMPTCSPSACTWPPCGSRRSAAATTPRSREAALNEALGLPLDTPHDLTTPLDAAGGSRRRRSHEEESARARTGPRRGRCGSRPRIAQTQTEAARAAALLPQVSFRVAFEADRQRFINRGGANWFAGGLPALEPLQRLRGQGAHRGGRPGRHPGRAQQRQIDSAVRLQVRSAYLDLKAAQERIEVAEAAVAEAEESLRIVKNRYENGLTNVTELLRSETALLETSVRRLAAVHDQRGRRRAGTGRRHADGRFERS